MNKDQHVQAKPTLKFDTDVHDPARDYKDSLSQFMVFKAFYLSDHAQTFTAK